MRDSTHTLHQPELAAFRQQVQAFLTQHWLNIPKAERPSTTPLFRKQATAQGYLNRNVPIQYGGSEQPPDIARAAIIQEEFLKARAPMEVAGPGTGMLVPTLLACGSNWQKSEFIAKTLAGEYRWAQGYSEPNAGSDLAAVRTKAELQGDQWIINGQKIWSSGADKAHFMFMLARTEPQAGKHDGISYLLIDLRQPGITIRPIRQITGGSEFCEIFFDNATTPATCLVGERGHGWAVSKTTLNAERSGFIGAVEGYITLHRKLVELAQTHHLNGAPAIEDAVIADRLLQLEAMITAHEHNVRQQFALRLNQQDPGRSAMMNKLLVTKIAAFIADVAKDILADQFLLSPFGREAEAGAEKWLNQYIGSLGIAIAGGTSNIQRNLIAERGYGLPRDAASAPSH